MNKVSSWVVMTCVLGMANYAAAADDSTESGPICDQRIPYRLSVRLVTQKKTNVSNSIE